ncbi:MAG: HEAT repeat domain-containing protein [Candidatus Freyarchaeota archaeon]
MCGKVNASGLTEDDVRRMAAEGDLEGLVKALKRGGNRRAQAIAAIHLGKTGDPRAVEPLIRALGDESHFVREPAALALGWLNDPRAVEPPNTSTRERQVRRRSG